VIYDTLLSRTLNLPRIPAFLQPFILAKKVEGRSNRTLEWYQESMVDFASFCASNGFDPSPGEVKPFHVRAWLASLQTRGLGKATINNRFRAFSSFISWSIGEGIINDTPLKNIRAPSVGKTVIPIFNADHVGAMLYLCPPNTWWGSRDRAIILTLLQTGVRLSELCGLTVTDVNFNQEDIKVKGKGNKERRVYLDKEAQRAIVGWLRHRTDNSEALFVSRFGIPLSPNAIKQLLHDLGQRANIKDVRCSAHTFRHTFAVSFLKAGGSLRHLQEIMGHTSMKPLEVYLRTIATDDAIEVHRQVKPFANWKL
jgi:site-specific recombinase XerD